MKEWKIGVSSALILLGVYLIFSYQKEISGVIAGIISIAMV